MSARGSLLGTLLSFTLASYCFFVAHGSGWTALRCAGRLADPDGGELGALCWLRGWLGGTAHGSLAGLGKSFPLGALYATCWARRSFGGTTTFATIRTLGTLATLLTRLASGSTLLGWSFYCGLFARAGAGFFATLGALTAGIIASTLLTTFLRALFLSWTFTPRLAVGTLVTLGLRAGFFATGSTVLTLGGALSSTLLTWLTLGALFTLVGRAFRRLIVALTALSLSLVLSLILAGLLGLCWGGSDHLIRGFLILVLAFLLLFLALGLLPQQGLFVRALTERDTILTAE